jgi:HNH endonuclease
MPRGNPARARIRDHFLAHIGEVVTKEDLIAVAPISEWARRVRELRDEEGWPILSYKNTLTPEEMEIYGLDRQLKPGEYILAGTEKMDVTARLINKDIRQAVLQRYGATCQFCGRGPHDPDPYNPNRKVIMHIDHIVSLKDGGTNELENLWPVCSVCNEGKKERSFIRKDVLQLLQEINIQPPDVQREVYMHLKERFG